MNLYGSNWFLQTIRYVWHNECIFNLIISGFRLRGDEQAVSGHHRSHVEGDHLHRLLRHRARGQRDEQRDDPVYDVTDPAAQNDPLLQQRPGTRQAVSGGDLDAGTGIIFRPVCLAYLCLCHLPLCLLYMMSLSLLDICLFAFCLFVNLVFRASGHIKNHSLLNK